VAPERCLKISTAILGACRCLSNDDISNSIRAIAAINPPSTTGGSTSDVKPPKLELAQEVGSQVPSSANLLAVPGDERTDFQQYDPEGQAITTRWVWA
jgi:hypothetical protein